MRGAWNSVAVVATMALCATLTGCGGQQSDTVPMPLPTSTSSVAPSDTPTSTPDEDPTLLPGGSALANRAYFDFVNTRLLTVNANPSSTAIVDNLVNAGFSKSNLEVTRDKTDQLRGPADSIQFAVRTSEGCLVGQFKSGGYSSMVGPEINDGTCLVGTTETIP